jgi:DNA-binding transcriptional regulator YbjK
MPDGRRNEITIDMPANVEQVAHALIDKGCHFDIEMLSTGMISMTCEKDEDLLSIEVCPNDERVVAGVEKIVKQSAAQQGVQWI